MERCEQYPRPQLVRREWQSLDGTWNFRFEREEWQTICVPYAFQCAKSGINDNRMCDRVSYRRTFAIPESWRSRRVLLNFGAVDYACEVYVNEVHIGGHVGGNVGFSLDVTQALHGGEELLRVEIYDPCSDERIPRGKQFWRAKPASIWYRRTTGIWQSVWLEPVAETHVERLRFTGDIDRGTVNVEYLCEGNTAGTQLTLAFSLKGKPLECLTIEGTESEGSVTVDLLHGHIFRLPNHGENWCWSPESPTLFDVEVSLIRDGYVLDACTSYFGLRKIEAIDGQVYLNNRPYYQKLVLDQGYWPDSLMTSPDADAFRKDIAMAKQMGFNGCRKHQKAEDPRFLYEADRQGFLVWGEIGACATFGVDMVGRLMREWNEAINRDYNHPSIVAWVTVNESWGVPNVNASPQQQALTLALYYQAKALDPTRLVVSNDGWEMTITDLCAIHHYGHGAAEDEPTHHRFREEISTTETLLRYQSAGRAMYARGYAYRGEPMLLTEFGGMQVGRGEGDAWGYTQVNDARGFLSEYARVMDAIGASQALRGFCYTQLTDVEQETNGLLTANRQFKVEPEAIKAINDRVH